MKSTGENENTRAAGFWRRQFAPQVTNRQRVFDWMVGVVIPVICVAADPIVFKGFWLGPSRGAILGEYKPFAYLLSFVSIMSMVAWLLFGEKLRGAAGVFAGLFAFGAGISLLVGILLAPLSLLGLSVFVGVLGFTPLFSAFVYLRNSVRAYRGAGFFLEKRVLRSVFLLAALFSGAVPFAVNAEIDRRIDRMLRGDQQSIRDEAERLKYFGTIMDFSRLARASCSTGDEARKKALQDAYMTLLGKTWPPGAGRFCGYD